jgi:hypothetical protein
MCCFSRPVQSVSETRIFARMGEGGRQFLVYSMNLDAGEELAMVLPIPVAAGSGEDAVRFVNLQKYERLFDDLDSGFRPPPVFSRTLTGAVASAAAPLKVLQVGSFEASFVPTEKDFSRLDERFRLSPKAFDELPGYAHYGFAVFKLKPGEQQVHPMAFEFPTASSARLFFPTVHIHDGKVHRKADFDHALYCQSSEMHRLKLSDWTESPRLAVQFMDVEKSAGIVLGDEHCYKRELRGSLPNKDTFVDALN